MFTNRLKIPDTTKTEFFEVKFLESDQRKSKLYCCVDFSQQCFRIFNMLTVHMCSDTGLFRHLSNHAFCGL